MFSTMQRSNESQQARMQSLMNSGMNLDAISSRDDHIAGRKVTG
jgi:hypothetical protein